MRKQPVPNTDGRRLGPLKWLAFLLLLFFCWFAADVFYVANGAENDYAASADVIVVLGCNPYGESGPSPCMRARGGHAADLYERGYSKNVIVTGNPTESGVLRSVLEDAGVPAGAISTESRSYNTIQNVANTRQILLDNGWHTVILVTEPFHINRSALIARDIWGSDVRLYPSPAVASDNWSSTYAKVYHVSRDAISLMLYQLKSLVGQRN